MKTTPSIIARPLSPIRQSATFITLLSLSGVAVASALFFVLISKQYALTVAVIGGAIVVGDWVFARVVFGKGQVSATEAVLLRMLLATVLKWALLFFALVESLVIWKLPPLAVTAGLLLGMGYRILGVLFLSKH